MSASRRAGFHGDHRGLGILASALAGMVAIAAFYVSYAGLTAIGELIGLGAFAFAVPVALDGAILAATFLAIVRKAQKRRSRLEWAIVYAASAASAAANFFVHTGERNDGYLAASVAAAAPLLLLLLSHAIIGTLIESEPRPAKAPKAPKAAPVVVTSDAPVAPAAKPASRPRPAARAARVPIDEASPEVAALLTEFDALAGNPASSSSQGSPESTRLSEVVRELADNHGIGFSALATRTDHLSSDSLRQRANKARKRLVNA